MNISQVIYVDKWVTKCLQLSAMLCTSMRKVIRRYNSSCWQNMSKVRRNMAVCAFLFLCNRDALFDSMHCCKKLSTVRFEGIVLNAEEHYPDNLKSVTHLYTDIFGLCRNDNCCSIREHAFFNWRKLSTFLFLHCFKDFRFCALVASLILIVKVRTIYARRSQ